MIEKFSINYYREMMEQALAVFSFANFEAVADEGGAPTKSLLRHDIDLSLGAAVRMSEVERDLGVSASYFIRLNATYYNPLSPTGHKEVAKILENGHTLGLHFDPSFYKASGIDLIEGVELEMDVLSRYFGVKVKSLSQHRPFLLGQADLSANEELYKYYTYNSFFQNSFKYISDSGQRWRENDVLQHVTSNKQLHILVHPVWWTKEGLTWQECLVNSSDETASQVTDKTDILLDRYSMYLKK